MRQTVGLFYLFRSMQLTNLLVTLSRDFRDSEVLMRRPGELPRGHPQFGSPPRVGAARNAAYGIALGGSRDSTRQGSGGYPVSDHVVKQSRSDAQPVRVRPSLVDSPGHSLRPDLADVSPKSDLLNGDQLNDLFASGGGSPGSSQLSVNTSQTGVSRLDGLKRKRFDSSDDSESEQRSFAKLLRDRSTLPSTLYPGKTLAYEWSQLD